MEKRHLLVVVVCLSVALAGCAGWGEDGPAGENENASEGNEDDLEDADGGSDGSDDGGGQEDSEGSDDSDDAAAPADDGSDGDDERDEDGVNDGTNDTADDSGDEGGPPGEGEGDGDPGDDNETADGDGNESANETTGGDADPETYTLTVVADAPVTVESTTGDAESTTREPTDGVAEFEVAEGGYFVTAEGYHRADVYVDSDREIVLQDTDGATLEITVIDGETGDPVPNATIEGVCNLYYSSGDEYISGEGDEDGIVTAQVGVTPTSCDANVYADGYEETVVAVDVPEDDGRTVELEPEEPDDAANETSAVAMLTG